jgi:hypothetical protein
MNQRMLRVAEREYLAYVRTKTFVIGILTLPLIFALFIGLPALMESMPKPPRPFTILDETGRYADRVVATLRERASGPGGVLSIEMRDHLYVPPEQLNLPSGTAERMEALQRQAMAGSLFAYFVISANDDQGTYRLAYYSTDPSAARLPQILRGILDESIRTENLRPFIDDEETLLRALRGVTFETHAITKEGEEVATAAHMARAYAPMAFVYLLWITILTMSSHLMTSTIEEKSSRIVEVLLSSVSPLEFISGKLGGLAAAGITMIVAWIATIALVSVAIPSVVVRLRRRKHLLVPRLLPAGIPLLRRALHRAGLRVQHAAGGPESASAGDDRDDAAARPDGVHDQQPGSSRRGLRVVLSPVHAVPDDEPHPGATAAAAVADPARRPDHDSVHLGDDPGGGQGLPPRDPAVRQAPHVARSPAVGSPEGIAGRSPKRGASVGAHAPHRDQRPRAAWRKDGNDP